MKNRNPDIARAFRPNGAEPRVGASAMQTQLQRHSIRVERKHVTFDLGENGRGRFLRIVEEVSGHRNVIIIPLSGIEDFRDAVNAVVDFSRTLPLSSGSRRMI